MKEYINFAEEKESKEGNGDRSLLYLPDMSKGAPIEAIEEMMNSLLEPDKECFLVEIRIKPTNNIKVFLDADTGISIDKCVTYNRALYKRIVESGLFPSDDFSLELSSPGLDEPLKLRRQYIKNIGRNVEVTTKDGVLKAGKLLEVGEDGITIRETRGSGRKQEFIQHDFLFDNIKTTKVQIQF